MAVIAAVSSSASGAVGNTASVPAPIVSPAVDGVLNLFERKSVVALGDAHGLAQEEDFYSTLIRDPRFARQVGNVVVEFGGAAAQNIIDRYVEGENVTFAELRRVWTDTAGAFAPGEPVPLGLVDFFVSVRAVNLKLPATQRIKVWLGDPKIDWSTIHSFQDLQPFLRMRDDSEFHVLSAEILDKQKKALLIIGLGHLFGPRGLGPLSSRLSEAYPGSLAIVSPFIGYVEPDCNARFLAGAQSWPTPSVVAPVAGTWVESQLHLPGCNFIPPERLQRLRQMTATVSQGGARPLGAGQPSVQGSSSRNGSPAFVPSASGAARALDRPAPPSPADMIAGETNILSGIKSDAILYLGPPGTLTQSPMEPSLYLDPAYFNELNQRARCCMPFGSPLDWQRIAAQASAISKEYER